MYTSHPLCYNNVGQIMAEPSRKLSSEEVNALMEGLKSGDLSASTTIKDGKEVEY